MVLASKKLAVCSHLCRYGGWRNGLSLSRKEFRAIRKNIEGKLLIVLSPSFLMIKIKLREIM